MSIPLIGGDLDFSEWLRGLIAAFISGGAGAVTSSVVVSFKDPEHFNFSQPAELLSLMFWVFIVSGVFGMFLFLRSKPVPDHKVVKTTVQETSVEPGVPPVKVVKTVVETHQEPLEPKP